MDPQLVQFLSDSDFILYRKGNIFGLSPIPKGGIVEFNFIQSHCSFNWKKSIINRQFPMGDDYC
jgi:hypothetical protein